MARPRSKQPELFGSPSEATPDWVTAYIDGGARGNPGPAGYGIVITDCAGTTLAELSHFLGHRTNNYAEYSALLSALRFAVFTRCEELQIYADSELVVKQIKGEYQVKNEGIRLLYDNALRWLALIPHFSISHVRRENNKEADRLANLAMDTRRNSVSWE